MDGVKPMKQLILVIMLATALGGCYVGVRSPIYGGTTEPPVVVPPPNAPVAAPVVIEPGWELYPWVYGAPYGYWAGGYFGGLPYRFAPQSYQFNCFWDSAHSVS